MKRAIRNFVLKHQLENTIWRIIKRVKKLRRSLLIPLDKTIAYILKLLPPSYRIKIKQWSTIIGKMDYQQRPIFLYIESMREYHTRRHSCSKEPETIAWIETLLKKGEVFYDIGACVGAYSLVAAKIFDNRVQVFAFEPAFQNFTQLVKNIALNNCSDSITPLAVALADKTSMEIFYYRNLNTGSASHGLGHPTTHGQPFVPVLKHPLITYRLDDLIEQFSLPLPNHIKIDVDGNEQKVLAGMPSILYSGGVKSLLIEIATGRECEVIINYLENMDFKLDATYHKKGSEMTNCVFVRH